MAPSYCSVGPFRASPFVCSRTLNEAPPAKLKPVISLESQAGKDGRSMADRYIPGGWQQARAIDQQTR